MRLQLAINVENLDDAIDFYSRIFGVELNKREPGYANFVVQQPPLKLVLFEAPGAQNKLNHLGVEVFEDADVQAADDRLTAASVEHVHNEEEACCFATQNKVIAYDPDGTMWEWYRLLDDLPTFDGQVADEEAAVCCIEAPAEEPVAAAAQQCAPGVGSCC